MKLKSRGFTLIELLIVIALLGALAVGLIGAIDPFEQLKKGTDTATRDLTNQVQTAIIRYYSVRSEFPWSTDPSVENLSGPNMAPAISNIVAAGELKSDFTTIQGAKLGLIFVTANSTTKSVAVCYLPSSRSFKSDKNTKYNQNGEVNTDTGTGACLGATTPGTKDDCYWCIE